MRKQVTFLAGLLLFAHMAAAAPGTRSPVLEALGDLVPPHHALHDFVGSVTWYGHRSPPPVRYVQPDFAAWADTLVETAVDPAADDFVAIWRDPEGAIRHVLAKGGLVRLFSIAADVVEFEDPGFHTQVGVARWGWVYGEGLLQVHRSWRLTLSPPDETGRPTGPPVPSALFSVITYEYRRGEVVPFRSRTYWSEEDRRAGRWGQRTWYEPDGRHRKTKHNPERPYPY